jgi:hypothetical protein
MKIEDHLIKMKGGKLYAPVYVRIALFRDEHPVSEGWGITAEIVQTDETSCLSRASITDPHGRVVATGHKREHKAHFPDFEEKSLTGAVGRALLMAGYGTQYALDELDEGERIVDTPIPGTMKMNATPTVTKAQDPQVAYKVAANLFMDNCKALFGEDVTPADAKSIYRRMFGSETMTTENLNAAINRMSTYDDGEKFANDLLVEEGEA